MLCLDGDCQFRDVMLCHAQSDPNGHVRRCNSKPRKSAAPAPAPTTPLNQSITNPRNQTKEPSPSIHPPTQNSNVLARVQRHTAPPPPSPPRLPNPAPEILPNPTTSTRRIASTHSIQPINANHLNPPQPQLRTLPPTHPHLPSPHLAALPRLAIYPPDRPTDQKLDTSDTQQKQKQKLRYTTRPHAPRNRTTHKKMAPRQLSSKAGRAEPGFARSAVSALLSAENRSVVSAVGMFAVSAFPFFWGFWGFWGRKDGATMIMRIREGKEGKEGHER
jgi:hypothetical protein